MNFVMYSSSGNMLEAYDTADEARAALNALVHDEPEAFGEVAVVAYDDEGEPTGEAILPDDPTHASAKIQLLAGMAVIQQPSVAIRGLMVDATRHLSGP